MYLKDKDEKKKTSVDAAVEKTNKPSRAKQHPMKQQVEKTKNIEEEEAEEFEPTPQGVRPALCIGKRKPKINWKKDKRKEEDSSSPVSPSLMEEKMEPLKDALAELTLEKQRLKGTVDRLRQRLARREKRIEKLVIELRESKTAPKSEEGKGSSTTVDMKKDGMELIKQELEATKLQLEKEQEEAERNKAKMHTLMKEAKQKSEGKDRKKTKKKDMAVEEDSESKTAVATRILQVMKRNQLLEKALPTKETNILSQFFTNCRQTETSHEVLTLLDKAIGTGIEQLVRSTSELDDPVDNAMRVLLLHTNKAKRLLLEVMLTESSFLPLAWGGRTVQVKSEKIAETKKEDKKPTKENKSTVKEQKSFVSSSYYPVYPKK